MKRRQQPLEAADLTLVEVDGDQPFAAVAFEPWSPTWQILIGALAEAEQRVREGVRPDSRRATK